MKKIPLKATDEDVSEDMDIYVEDARAPKDGSGPTWPKGMVRFGFGDMTAVTDRAALIKALQDLGDA